MASPAVVNTATTNGTTGASPAVVNLPASIVAGNTLVLLFQSAGNVNPTFPAGWTVFDSDGTHSRIVWRKADGTEGATINVTHATGARWAAICYQISGATDPTVTPPEKATKVTGTAAAVDPGACTPTGGAKDYLWLWMAGAQGENTNPPAGNPTNYTNPLGANSGTAGITSSNCTCFSAQRALNASSEDGPSWTMNATSAGWCAWTVAVHPAAAANITVTPGVKALVLATFAPTVAVSANQLVVPGVTALTLATFAPVITASDHQLVTPGVATLATTAYAPVVGLAVVPATAALMISGLAPAVIASDHQNVVPDATSLVLTAFEPVAATTAHLTVVPDVAALTTAALEPSVAVSDNQSVMPDPASLVLTGEAPSVTAGANQEAQPGVASLVLTPFAPDVAATGSEVVTPSPASMTLIGRVPKVTVITFGTGTRPRLGYSPGPARRVSRFAPVKVQPLTAHLRLLTFAPAVDVIRLSRMDEEEELLLVGAI